MRSLFCIGGEDIELEYGGGAFMLVSFSLIEDLGFFVHGNLKKSML